MRQPSTLDSGADSILGGLHDAPDDSKPLGPETRLARAVLWRAYEDIGISDWSAKTTEAGGRSANFDAETHVRGPARRFCVSMIPELGFDDRLFWTDAADIPEPLFRALCKRKIAEVKRAEAEGREAKVVTLDSAFARLLDAADGMDPQALDTALEALARLEDQAA